MSRGIVPTGAVLFITGISWITASALHDSPTPNISPTVPPDIEGGAPNARLEEAVACAWYESIAPNWPHTSFSV